MSKQIWSEPLIIMMLALGLVVLTVGAEILVRGASRLAETVGISPLVVGLTVVAFGTSSPELVISLQAALAGKPDVALGNVVGSNIFNVLFILGLSAMIVPLRVSAQLLRFDVPLMVLLAFAVLGLGLDGRIGRLDGLLLTVGVVAYTLWAIIKSRRDEASARRVANAIDGSHAETPQSDISNTQPVSNSSQIQRPVTPRAVGLNIFFLLVGLGMLVVGSNWFIDAVIELARALEISELVIGLTVVAAGTSLPEVATSVMAAIRGERDIAVGNVVGSCIFNIMAVLGITSLMAADGVAVAETAIKLDIPVMIAVSAACLPIFFTDHAISRWEGTLFFAYYVIYTAYLVIAATQPEVTRNMGIILVGFVLPLTALGLIISAFSFRRKRLSS